MSYCRNCGQPIPENGRFCTSCGKNISAGTLGDRIVSGTSVPIVVQVVAEKSGGWLALKGCAVTIVIAAIARAAVQKDDTDTLAAAMVFAFGIGGAYIATKLRKWKRGNVPVNGAGLAWIVTILLGLGCIGGFRLLIAGNSGHVPPDTARGTTTNNYSMVTPSPEPKLSAREMKEPRNKYARDFDQKLIEEGIESRTLAWGPDDTTLRITYALTGRVTANELGKSLDFDRLKSLGFKKVELTNDFGGDAGASFVWYVQ